MFIFLKPNPLIAAMIAQVSLIKYFFPLNFWHNLPSAGVGRESEAHPAGGDPVRLDLCPNIFPPLFLVAGFSLRPCPWNVAGNFRANLMNKVNGGMRGAFPPYKSASPETTPGPRHPFANNH
jgi:hypothetical protein